VCQRGPVDLPEALERQGAIAITPPRWAGTALAALALQEFEDFDTKAAAKRNITKAIERVAERLGNTKAVCRKFYIHPAVIDAYMDRSLVAILKERAESELRESLPRLPAERRRCWRCFSNEWSGKCARLLPIGRIEKMAGAVGVARGGRQN